MNQNISDAGIDIITCQSCEHMYIVETQKVGNNRNSLILFNSIKQKMGFYYISPFLAYIILKQNKIRTGTSYNFKLPPAE